MKLVVAEKPSVGRTIAAVLGAKEKKDGCLEGSGYIVTWCVGHLVELALPTAYDPKYAQQPWKMEDLPIFPGQWKFQVSKTTADQYKIVKQLMLDERVSEIICATDAGREGECIDFFIKSPNAAVITSASFALKKIRYIGESAELSFFNE